MREMREQNGTRSAWRFYPLGLAAAMGFVMVVNAGMVWGALSTFPGAASNDGFDESNIYNRVLDAVDKQNALGWSLSAASHEGRAVLHLRDRDGRPLAGAAIEAAALRPLGPAHDMALHFHPAADGTYVADAALPLPGQWDLMLRAVQGGQEVWVTRRILVK